MTEQPQTPPAPVGVGPESEQPQPAPAEAGSAPHAPAVGAEDRPEIAVGAAFAGGFLAALILKRLVR